MLGVVSAAGLLLKENPEKYPALTLRRPVSSSRTVN